MSYSKHILISILILSTACIVALYVMVGSALPAQVHPQAPHTPPVSVQQDSSIQTSTIYPTAQSEYATSGEMISLIQKCKIHKVEFALGFLAIEFKDNKKLILSPTKGLQDVVGAAQHASSTCASAPSVVYLHDSCDPSDMCI